MERKPLRETKSAAIARAALSLFSELGVRGATTRAIARRARTTEGNLYRHYASKEDLARKVIASCLEQFGGEVARALDGVTGPRERLAEFVRAYFRYALDHQLEYSLTLDAQNRRIASLPGHSLRPRRILVNVLTDGMCHGQFVRGDPEVLASFIAGGLARAVQLERASGQRASLESFVEEMVSVVLRLVRSD